MKIDLTADLSGNLNELDIILVKRHGFFNWLERTLEGQKWNEAHIVLKFSGKLHVCAVVHGRLAVGPTLVEWGGYMTGRKLRCKSINLTPKPDSVFVGLTSIGKRFSCTASAIGHIFGIEGIRKISQIESHAF